MPRHRSGFRPRPGGPVAASRTVQWCRLVQNVALHTDTGAPVIPLTPLQPRHHCLRVLRTIIRADSDPARQTLFARVIQSRPVAGFVYRLHGRLAGTVAAPILPSCYGLAAFLRIRPSSNPRARVLAVASHENAQAQVARVMSWVGPDECGWITTGSSLALASPRRLLEVWRHAPRVLRLIRRIDARYGFLVSCRTASALAWYARATAILGSQRPGAVLVSSDANPEEAGFLGAARALGIPRVFVSHAYPTPFSPPLDFTLSILEGDAAVDAHRGKGPIGGTILLAGIEGHSAPLDPQRFDRPEPIIGIFPPKAFSWPTFVAIIEDCRRHFRARQILVRWHPSMLEPPRLHQVLSDLSGIVESDRAATLPEIAEQCDWVVAGENSNVHLPVQKLGIPTVVVKGLGLYTNDRSDLYGFVANGIVFPPLISLRDLRTEALQAFFTGWPQRFARYDASYLRPRHDVGAEVRHAVLTLAAGGPTTT
jgi:hypothetical protein